MEIIRIEHVSKTYGKGDIPVKALDDVSLSVDRGEFVAIVGSSGSGKSTLLHILGGVDSPDSGKIFIQGEDISKYTEDELALFRRRKVGLVYQFYNLIPNLSIEKNISLPLVLDKQKVDKDKLINLAEKLGIKNKLSNFPHELSGGQQQRAAIARSLIYSPALLLADEPTGNLDRKNTDEIMSLLQYANKTYNQTVLMVTHDERLALSASRIVELSDGKIVKDEAL
ncbi:MULTISPECIES: ABC transporter ATP-binding protein [unclassified Treponema]|uniref:ABC transporter ATP-binding protein n=1 Tax=unclassified Treponema TaxID=2638727 RepID=UPI0020A41A9F|nr:MULTISPECIES: ABC transporter ATP-binding protein [unclassified Treponema]UTC68167.1 ABC transporter ATP-binding protein [Treponema sp. OMZ 789]UTC70887.1 ABC transporter ATP-binding protein [Treponema sp. OMZ 790]UTC73627.1 ABC transporter ATP-binding protein [Treponema sp. OMZ 791]